MSGAPQEALNIVHISRKISAFLSLLVLCAGTGLGQTAAVTRTVNLCSDTSTANPPIRLLLPPEQVQPLEAGKTNGYYQRPKSKAS